MKSSLNTTLFYFGQNSFIFSYDFPYIYRKKKKKSKRLFCLFDIKGDEINVKNS